MKKGIITKMNPKQMLVDPSKYALKSPYTMTAEFITVHNTANDASAQNEISYMRTNDTSTSFHYAIDDVEVVQGLPENRNGFHAGDGQGSGNRKSIGIEICYSKSGGDRFVKAEQNAAKFIAQKLKEKGWGLDRVKKHQDWSGKYCPHRTLDMGWGRFLNMVSSYMSGSPTPAPAPSQPTKKSNEQIVNEVMAGLWGNNPARKENLEKAGYDYNTIQNLVNQRFSGGGSTPAPTQSLTDIARQVIAGSYGNEPQRSHNLRKAGYDPAQVQAEVNRLYGIGNPAPAPAAPQGFAVGNNVVVTNPVDYNGTRLGVSGAYTVMEVKGDRIVIGRNGIVTAAIKSSNLRRV